MCANLLVLPHVCKVTLYSIMHHCLKYSAESDLGLTVLSKYVYLSFQTDAGKIQLPMLESPKILTHRTDPFRLS